MQSVYVRMWAFAPNFIWNSHLQNDGEKKNLNYNRMIFEAKAIENQHLTSNKCHLHAVDDFKISLPVCARGVCNLNA